MRLNPLVKICGLVFLALCFLVSCQSRPPEQMMTPDPLAELAHSAPFVTKVERAHPEALPEEVVALLKQKKEAGQTDHFGLLVEYGLRVHWHYLQQTRLARELPIESDLMLAELVRIAEIPKYTTAHEAGWLNSQFYGAFDQTGYSSYQIYLWVKEHFSTILSDDIRFPNRKQIGELLETIDHSGLNGVGGGGVCHYGCL